MRVPPGEALTRDGLARVGGIADIVVAGDSEPAHSQPAQQPGRIRHVVIHLGAVDRDIAGMDHEIGPLFRDPIRDRRPVVGKMRLAPAQMGVGDLNYPHRPSPK
jgi:hypothetical protein